MINDREIYIDRFARIFVLAIEQKVNLNVITNTLSLSSLIRNIEKDDYSELMNNSITSIVKYYFDCDVLEDDSLYQYNDAYWCGNIYMNIFYKYNKPLSYIFLILPLNDLLEMYEIYHEMDITSVYELFENKCKENTILKLLLQKHCISNTKLAKLSNVSINTISHLKQDDKFLYAASFNSVHRIALALNEPDNLFLENINNG